MNYSCIKRNEDAALPAASSVVVVERGRRGFPRRGFFLLAGRDNDTTIFETAKCLGT
jgi:hypothetical protein